MGVINIIRNSWPKGKLTSHVAEVLRLGFTIGDTLAPTIGLPLLTNMLPDLQDHSKYVVSVLRARKLVALSVQTQLRLEKSEHDPKRTHELDHTASSPRTC